jgi:ribosomal protein S18 acetylase RimI-like enzyme
LSAELAGIRASPSDATTNGLQVRSRKYCLYVATTVRLADKDDLDAASELAVALGDPSNGDPRIWRAALVDDLSRADRCLFVAEEDGTLVGEGRVRHFDPPTELGPNGAPAGYYLMGVGVLPFARHRGIGRDLTIARMAWTASRSRTLWFFTEVSNEGSLALHASLGFRQITRDFNYPGVSFPSGSGVLCCADLLYSGRS